MVSGNELPDNPTLREMLDHANGSLGTPIVPRARMKTLVEPCMCGKHGFLCYAHPDRAHRARLRERLYDNLNRFVLGDEDILTDEEFVKQVFARWSRDRGVHLGDPGDGVDLTGVLDD